MLNSKNTIKDKARKKIKSDAEKISAIRFRRLASMGKISFGILNAISSPIDSVNRFINLALHDLEEGSQPRQFLLESKQGIRKTSVLLKRLNTYAKKIEKEISEISERTD